MLPLEGLVVLDLTRAVSGPLCTMNLGDLGARVIKIEEAGRGDETRQWGPPFIGDTATYFLSVNRNKESVAADLKNPADLELVRRIATKSDILIENFRPGVMDRLGLSYAALSELNPRLIYASISGFGQDGPDREKPGYDLIVQAMSGLMRVSARPGGPPAKSAFPVSDVLTALYTGQAVLAAAHRRSQTGRGSYIEVALLECLLASMTAITGSYLMSGVEPGPMGAGQANITPYQIFDTADQEIVIGVTNERIWQRFCAAVDKPEWLADPRYDTNSARTVNRPDLVADIEALLATQPAAHWLGCLEAAGVPCGAVNKMAQIMEHRQVTARGAVVDVEGLRQTACPMRFDGVQPRYKRPQALGEATEAIRAEFCPG